MKKFSFSVVVLVLIFAIVFISLPTNVQAGFTATKEPIAAGGWNTGTESDVDLTEAPAPEWLQLMTTNAVVVKQPTKICHELRGGNYHWVAEIRKLKGDKWVKVETYTEWTPNEEGVLMVCAQAPSAGTYALFGYYNGPQEFFTFDEPTIIPTPICGVNEVVVNGFCVCPAPNFELKNGACSPVKPKLD